MRVNKLVLASPLTFLFVFVLDRSSPWPVTESINSAIFHLILSLFLKKEKCNFFLVYGVIFRHTTYHRAKVVYHPISRRT